VAALRAKPDANHHFRIWEQLSWYRRFGLNGGAMPKPKKPNEKPKGQPQPESLKGWKQISEFLGEPVSVVKRWAADGMPLHREGQFVSTSSDELNRWLGQESGKPVHVATESTDLTAELKRGLSFVRREKPQKLEKKRSALSGKVKR
jgi:hypothetical protein